MKKSLRVTDNSVPAINRKMSDLETALTDVPRFRNVKMVGGSPVYTGGIAGEPISVKHSWGVVPTSFTYTAYGDCRVYATPEDRARWSKDTIVVRGSAKSTRIELTLIADEMAESDSFAGAADPTTTTVATDASTDTAWRLLSESGGSLTVDGPTEDRVFTFPDADATVLTTDALVTVPQGGTGAATITGVLKGNGTSAIGAATSGTDYSAGTSGLTTGILKSTTTTGALSIAAAASDYVAPSAYASANGLTMATDRLLGRTTATTGAAEEISVAGSLSLAAGVLTGTGGAGTVTAVSVASSNGFAGSSSGGATPALTLSTTITGVLKGNGTAISAATVGTDYSVGTSALATGILKSTTATGALSIAAAGDFPTLDQNTSGTAAIATATTITNDVATAATMYPTWVTAVTGNLPQKVSSTKLSFVPSTGILTATGFAGALTGNVTGNASGSAGTVTSIAAHASTELSDTAVIARTNAGQTFTGTAANTFQRTGLNGLGPSLVVGLLSDAKTAGDGVYLTFSALDSASAIQEYGSLRFLITNPTAGAETSEFQLYGFTAGSSTKRVSIASTGLFTYTGNQVVTGQFGAGNATGLSGSVATLRADAAATGLTTGQLHVVGATNAAQRTIVGYNTTSDYGWIECGIQGSAFKPLILQPGAGSNVGIGTTPAAKLDVDQSSTTAAISVLRLDQADVSEEFFEFETTIGTGNAMEAVGAKTLTTTHFIKVTIPGGLTRYIPCGTIA